MLAVIKGDIIRSRELINQESWLVPLKRLFSEWGKSPRNWEIVWGDFFQIEIADPAEALIKAIEIKTLIKKTQPSDNRKKISPIDVRMAIGIGEKTYSGSRISESNGSAFIFAGEKFDRLKKENITLGIKSPWGDFDRDINLYLRLAGIFMDKWSLSSVELMEAILHNPDQTQEELGNILGIKQSAVSSRWNTANIAEVLAVNQHFKEKLKKVTT